MTDTPVCAATDCTQPAIMAIRTLVPRNKSLVTTVYQDEADAPKVALRYCGKHGVHVAANLTALTDSSLHPKVTFDV